MKAEKLIQYEFYAEGVITKETYLNKKLELSREIDNLENAQREGNILLDEQKSVLDSANSLSSLAAKFKGEEKLTRRIVTSFIESVYVFDQNRLDVVFLFEDEIRNLLKSVKE